MMSAAQQDLPLEKIREVVETVLPEKKLKYIRDRGLWVRRNYELVFEGGARAFMKLHVHLEWLDSTVNEAFLCKIFRENDLPAPETLFIDPAGAFLGFPFIIQSALPGKSLLTCLKETTPCGWPDLFFAVGKTYAKLHRIKGSVSGVWDGSPEKTLPVSPNDFYLEHEIIGGSGKVALDAGRLSQKEYDKIINVWKEALQVLKSHEPSLVHGSAFPWTVCLTRRDENWQVSRLNAMGDFLWWDPAYDQASLVYPPGYAWPDACLKAFWDAYGAEPEPWRINPYALLQHLCALNKAFMPPPLQKISLGLTEMEMAERLRGILATI